MLRLVPTRAAGSASPVFRLDLDADLLEQRRGQYAAGVDDYGVVANPRALSVLLDLYVLWLDPLHRRVEHHRHSPRRARGLELVPVFLLCPRERSGAVGQRDDGTGLLGDRDGALERAVAAADDQHVHSGVLRCVPVTWVKVDGVKYLVAMMGEESDWVHNARAAGGHVIFRRGKRRDAVIEELPVPERAPIIRAWYSRTGGSTPRHYIGLDPQAPLEEFEKIAPRWPVFRLPAGALP